MDLTPKQQAIELINKSQSILIAPGRPDGDSIGSAVALHIVLQKLGKQVTTVVLDPISQTFSFLPKLNEFAKEFRGVRDFVITLDSAVAKADKLAYNFKDDQLNIVVTPKVGRFTPQDVSFSDGNFHYDAIIALDAADLDQLGTIYAEHPKLFQSVPVLNIDHHASNDYYGAINLVDLTAASTAEILVGIIEALGSSLMDEDVATAILTGIINDTGSFQNSNTTPKSLTVAAQMVGFGARQQEIIKYLFKTRPLSTLKLWGRILSNLQHDVAHKLAWSVVSPADLSESGASGEDIGGVIDELLTSVPGADVVVLLSEREPRVVSGSIRTKKGVDAADIAKIFGGGGHPGAAGFRLTDTDIKEGEQVVISRIKEYQANKSAPAPTLSPDEIVAPSEENTSFAPLDK